jgi:MoaA/NifB/PqqE/SkfB family radical SAM enzyme
VIGYPVELVIDPCDICNLHCPLCPTGQGSANRSKGRMSFDNFRKIIDELGPYLYRVDLHNWGEPLLNDEIYSMISYAHNNNIEVRVSSNFNVINQVKAEKLVKSGLDVLIVSLDGASPETYVKYRVGGSFDKVTSGIKMVSELKTKLKTLKPVIILQFLVMRHNEHEMSLVKGIADELGANQVDLWSIRCDMGREIFWDDKTRLEKTANWLPQNEDFCVYDIKTGARKRHSANCNFLWVQSAINWNGSVSPCCASYNEAYDFGNAFEIGFKNVWNNNKYRQAREIVRTKKFNKGDLQNVCYYCVKNGFF